MHLLPSLLLGCAVDAELLTVRVGGAERAYWLHVPADLPAGAPVVLAFHGGGSPSRHPGRGMPRFTDLSALADERGFVAVYPEAEEKNWNDGRGMTEADDLAYFDAVLAEVLADTGADPDRVFVTGISNGGFFSDRLACDRADVLAGAAIVAATEARGLPCAPARPIPVLFVPGTDDPLVPFEGGPVASDRGFCRSVADTVADWRVREGCAEAPVTTRWDDTVDDGTTVTEEVACPGTPSEVRLLTVEGGGHTWPGGSQYLPRFVVGRVSEEFDASRVIVDFFLERG
jgi:polyhydroxybutyrate depolymerase